MMLNLRNKEGPLSNTKQESIGHSPKSNTTTPTTSSTRQWSSSFKNPRIVRVSQTFGGKDRHSKVYTIKGLRDRRIRLSIPTAIQLYDLQDRLGLSQPSKVIDWLIDSTKLDIDKLPPLPIIPGSFDFSHNFGVPLNSSLPNFDPSLLLSSKKGNSAININSTNKQDFDNVNEEDEDHHHQSIVGKLKYWNSNEMIKSKQKEDEHGSTSQILAQNLFPMPNSNNSNNSSNIKMLPHYTHPSISSNNSMLNYYNLEPSSHDNNNQHVCPSMATTSLFPQNQNHHHTHQVENDMRQFNYFSLSNNNPFSSSFHNSSGLDMKPFLLSMNHNPHLQQDEEEVRQGKINSHSLWKE